MSFIALTVSLMSVCCSSLAAGRLSCHQTDHPGALSREVIVLDDQQSSIISKQQPGIIWLSALISLLFFQLLSQQVDYLCRSFRCLISWAPLVILVKTINLIFLSLSAENSSQYQPELIQIPFVFDKPPILIRCKLRPHLMTACISMNCSFTNPHKCDLVYSRIVIYYRLSVNSAFIL